MKKVLSKNTGIKKIRASDLKARSASLDAPGIVKKSGSRKVLTVPSTGIKESFATINEFFMLKDISGYTANELAALLGTTGRTIRTKRDKKESFDILQTERLRKLIHLFQEGNQVFGSRESFVQWLQKPAYGLDYALPIALMKQPGGLDQVVQELVSIKFGDTV